MTVLPTVRRQLLVAAERHATCSPAAGAWRRGTRRRWFPRAGTLVAAVSVVVALGVAAAAVSLLRGAHPAHPAHPPAHRSTSLLARPLHFPSLGPGGRCPTSTGRPVHNPNFSGTALGRGPVRVAIEQRGDIRHGRVDFGRARARRWRGLQTLWFALPRYDGRFVVRAARLGRSGPIAVTSGGGGLSPGSGPLIVAAGATANTYPDGYRTVPGATWIKSPGCYAWQVDGRGFSEVIVFDALRAHGGARGG